jgi:hypothetical protein
LATNSKDFKIKNGLIVEGATATVNGSDVITEASSVSDLSDVNTAGAEDSQALVYNSETGTWVPGAAVGSGAASYTISETAPETPNAGDVWFDSVTGNTYIYYSDGDTSQWVQSSGTEMVLDAIPVPSYIVSETAPADPINGDFWFDTSTGNIYVYYSDTDTSQWVQTAGPNLASLRGSDFIVQTTAPGTPVSGDVWYDSSEGFTYIYYEDEDSSQWIQFGLNRNGADGTSNFSIQTAAPESPTKGDVWYDSSSGFTYIYYQDADSSQWVQFGLNRNGIDGTFATAYEIKQETGTSYTLILSDAGKLIEMGNALDTSLTIPANATAAFAIGTSITILQVGVGQVTIAGAAGVTLNATPGLKTNNQWSHVTLIKRGLNSWVAFGDLAV